MLIILSGLSGVGKTSIARELARQIGAMHLRIDSIEQAMRDSELVKGEMTDAGYRIAYAIALDSLRAGQTVIADCVNPISITRDAWIDIAKRAGVKAIEVEIVCTDRAEHRRRVETRSRDIPGSTLPSWDEVIGREYHPWDHEHLVIDAAKFRVEEAVAAIRDAAKL